MLESLPEFDELELGANGTANHGSGRPLRKGQSGRPGGGEVEAFIGRG